MNNREQQIKRMQLQEMTNYGTGSQLNRRKGVNVHGDGFRHFLVKAAVYKVLQETGHSVRTEVEFPNGYVADVIDLNTFRVYEVETNATTQDIIAKIENFNGFEVIDDVHVIDPIEAMNEVKDMDDDSSFDDRLQKWVQERVML